MFRFTIRDVLWLTVVVGLGFGSMAAIARYREQQRIARLPEFKGAASI
jgi:hypothetical protein